MKRIPAIILFAALALILYINVGELARISLNIADVKFSNSERENSHKNLLCLVITTTDRIDGSCVFTGKNEIRYHGKLYDIEDQHQQNNILYLHVTQDEKEDGLLSELKEEIDQWFNYPQKAGEKKPVIKKTDLLKDFIPAEKFKLSLLVCSESFTIVEVTSITAPILPVAQTPPKLG